MDTSGIEGLDFFESRVRMANLKLLNIIPIQEPKFNRNLPLNQFNFS